MLLTAPAAFSQTYPNKLSADSVDPEADAQFIKKLRQKMEQIHVRERRPTVALVLSGGGAKGAALVGAIKYLEEQEIPVDMVFGTSIGGLVGGLYSVGYGYEQMRDLFLNQDWDMTLTDKVPQSYESYAARKYQDVYLVSIPFRYAPDEMIQQAYEQERYQDKEAQLKMGGDGASMNTQMGISELASSLPSGYAYGFNVNNLISSLTVGYHDSLSFRELPIPFCCVAADMVSCKAKNWTGGSLRNAMRSTMSIPGLFDPVRTGSLILVDGGVRNNFPTDIARAIGADYIIGIDLSDEDPASTDINNVGEVLFEFIRMLGQDSFNKNVSIPDVLIKPDLKGYNMLSFEKSAIVTMLDRGYAAAKQQAAGIKNIKTHTKGAKPRLNGPAAIDLSVWQVALDGIEFRGIGDEESSMMMDMIGLKVSDKVGKKELDDAMRKLQATGAFDSVTYSLYGSQEPFRLVFHCSPAPRHHFGFGFRMDSEEWPSLLFNVGLNKHRLMGSKFDITGKLGQNRYLTAHYSLDIPELPTVNVEATASRVGGKILYDPSLTPEFTMHRYEVQGYLSKLQWKQYDVKAGIRMRYFSIPQSCTYGALLGILGEGLLDQCYLGAFASGGFYNMDNRYFPSRGVDLSAEGSLDFARPGVVGFEAIPEFRISARGVIPIGERFSLIPSYYLRNVFGVTQDGGVNTSYAHFNYAGGTMAGRYYEQQMPFVGFCNMMMLENCAAVLNLDARTQIANNLYVSVKGGYVKTEETIADMVSKKDITYWGASLEAGYNSIVGPVKASLHYSDATNSLGFYVSLGFDF